MSAICACESNDFDKVKELIDKGELVLFNHVYFGNIEELSFLIEKVQSEQQYQNRFFQKCEGHPQSLSA